MLRTTVALAGLAFANGAFAQSTSTAMDMGGGMTHVDTMGPNGAMSSSNCTSMGGGMTNCQTMDMSQPQRSYPTPDMSRPQTNGTTLSFIGGLIAQSRERSFQKKLNEKLTSGDCNGAATFALLNGRDMLSDQIHRYCMEQAKVGLVAGSLAMPASAHLTAPVTPAPMSFVSMRPLTNAQLTDAEFFGFTSTPLTAHNNADMVYVTKYLGRTFTTLGPKGVPAGEVISAFKLAWDENPWIPYASDASNTLHYSWNINSIKIYSSGYEVWIRKYYNGYVNGKPSNKPSQTKVLQFVNCEAKMIQTFEIVEYNDSGAVTSSYEGSGTPSRIVPETVGSALYDEMCKFSPQAPLTAATEEAANLPAANSK